MFGRNIEERLIFFKKDSFRTIVVEKGQQRLDTSGTYKLNLLDSTLLIHYAKTLGAFHVGGRIMIIESTAAQGLIDKYFKT